MDEAIAKALLIYGTDNAMDAVHIYQDKLGGIAMDVGYLTDLLKFFKDNKLINSYKIKTEWIDKSIGHRKIVIKVDV